MALTLDVDTDRVLGLDAYLEHVRREVDVDDEASILASAPLLRALANDRTFLADLLVRGLVDWPTFQADNPYASRSFVLGRGRGFFLRANVWTPDDGEDEAGELQRQIGFYDVAHDHNFSFLTVGYHGPGYSTSLYEVEPGSFAGVVGEAVDLEFVGDTDLPPGKVMYFRAGRDVHVQRPPPAPSISLNLMIVPPTLTARDQYYFDLRTRTIAAVVGNQSRGRLLLCELAAALGDAATAERLDALAGSHPSRRIREAAASARGAILGRAAGRTDEHV